MTKEYQACPTPAHERFGQRIEDCKECMAAAPTNPRIEVAEESNPRIETNRQVGTTIFQPMLGDGSELLEELAYYRNAYAACKEELDSLKAGMTLKGWWCLCEAFNGEERAFRIVCRKCGREKIRMG